MIDEKKLIEEMQARRDFWINKSAKYTKDESTFGADMCNIMAAELNTILHMIDEQPKIGEWIPCSEKLPENDYDTVMVFLDSKIYDIAIWHNEHGFRPWYAAHFEASPPEWKACVTAWMPLPEL